MRKKTTLSIISLIMVLSVFCASCASAAGTNELKAETRSSNQTATEAGLTGTYTSFVDGWITDDEARETVTPSSDQIPSTYDSSLYVLNEADYKSVEIDLESLSESYLDGAVTVNNEESVTTITIKDDAAKYNIVLTGASEKGVTVVSKKNDYMITLNGVSITAAAASGEQALKLKSSTTCFLVLSGKNTLNGCSGAKNVLKASGALVISGDGSLDVYAVTKNGIVSDDVIVVNGGNISVTLDSSTSDGTGIKPVNGYVQNAGTVTITGLNMTEGSENKGIKVEGDESESGRGKGYVLINGGEIVINTSGKGITAGFDTTEDGDTSSTENDPSADVFINNGLITITTYATPREDSSSDANDGVSPEGIEGKRSVTINGGKIILNTTDDAINASEDGTASIVINGGLVYAHSSANDAVDSNGTITMNGGVLIALGAGVPEGGIDCDFDSCFAYNGGTLIALGGTNQLPQSTSSTGYYLYSGMSMNGNGGFPGGNMTAPQGTDGNPPAKPDGESATQPSDMTPPQGTDGNPPQKPDGEEDTMTPPEMPQNNFGGMGGRGGFNFADSTDAPEPPEGATAPGSFNGGFGGGMGSLSSGDTIALLDSNGGVILAFTVPEGTESSSVLIASDKLKEGSYSITKDATVTSASNTFASSLSLGDVTVEIASSSAVTVAEKGSSITL